MKKILAHRLFKNTAALFVMQVFTYAAPFIALPYLTRVLGSEGFGLLITLLSLLIMANVITDYGFNLSATYLISKKRENTLKISKIISSVYLIKLALVTSTFVATAIYTELMLQLSTSAKISIYLTIFFQCYTSIWLFQGIERMKLITYFTIGSRLTYIALIYLTVKNSSDYDVALACNTAASGIAFILCNIFIYKEGYRLTKTPYKFTRYILKNSSNFFLSRITLQATSSVSVLVLSHSLSASQVGLFGASQKLFQAVIGILQPLNQALYPYLAKTKNIKLLLQIVAASAVMMLIPLSIGMTFSEEILGLIFGDEFREAHNILEIYLITGYVGVVCILMGYPAFAAIDKVEYANKSVIFGSMLQIIALVFLFFTDGISTTSVAYSILITEITILFLRSYWFYQNFNTSRTQKSTKGY